MPLRLAARPMRTKEFKIESSGWLVILLRRGNGALSSIMFSLLFAYGVRYCISLNISKCLTTGTVFVITIVVYEGVI